MGITAWIAAGRFWPGMVRDIQAQALPTWQHVRRCTASTLVQASRRFRSRKEAAKTTATNRHM